MYRSILGAHACILVSLCLFATLPWVGKSWVTAPMAVPRGAIALVLFTVAVDVFLHGERPRHLLLMVGTFLIATPSVGTHPVPNDSSVGMLLSAVGLMAARLFRLPIALAMVAGCGAAHAVTLALLDLPGTGLSLDAMVLALSTAAAAVSFVNAMQDSALTTDRVAQSNRERELDLVREATERRATGDSQRVLHDDVLGTLHLIAEGMVAPDRIRGQCSDTVAAMRTMLEVAEARPQTPALPQSSDLIDLPPSYVQLVRELRRASPVALQLTVLGRGRRLPVLDPDRLAALQRALLEGARNAARHALVDSVSLTIWADRREVHATIEDRGRGSVDGVRPGFGLVESVRRPLHEVGGRSSLRPREGGGATLAVSVPHQEDFSSRLELAHRLTIDSLGPIRTLPRSIAIPLAGAWSVVAVHDVVQRPHAWPQLFIALGWLVATLLIVRRVERRGPDGRWVGAMAVLLLALQVAGILMMPPGAMLDFRSWSIGMSALPLVVLLLNLPLRIGALVLVVHPAVVIGAAALRPELSEGIFPWGSLNAVVTCPVPSLLLGVLIRRQGRSLEAEKVRELALAHEDARREWRAATAQLYFAHARTEVLPWLRQIATGEALIDAQARERARLLAIAARDDLFAPGFFDDPLRAKVARFREDGGTVELRAGLTPGASQRMVGRVLADLLPLSRGHRIIVSPPADRERFVRISVVPAPPKMHLDNLGHGLNGSLRTDVDDFRAVLLIEDLPTSG